MTQPQTDRHSPASTSSGLVALAWLVVIVPMLWAIWQTLIKVAQLFG